MTTGGDQAISLAVSGGGRGSEDAIGDVGLVITVSCKSCDGARSGGGRELLCVRAVAHSCHRLLALTHTQLRHFPPALQPHAHEEAT